MGHTWPPWKEIRDRLSAHLHQSFEFGLLMEFPDGKVSLGQHADNESSIVEDSIIACLSFGQARSLVVTDLEGKLLWKLKVEPGTLYTMEGKFQKFLKHGVPQEASLILPRWSLTLRHILHPSQLPVLGKRKNKENTGQKAKRGRKKKTYKNSGRGKVASGI